MGHGCKRAMISVGAAALCGAVILCTEIASPISHATEMAPHSCCTFEQVETSEAPKPAQTQPQATTRPQQRASIRGIVTLKGSWDLQKPDLTRAVIYLASNPVLDDAPAGIDHATVAQKDKSFVPNFTVVPRGTTIEFPNWDDFDHNVFSRSKAAPAFDLDRYPRGQSKSRVFEKVGVVQVFCNIHPQMRAIIFVTPNRYFARADADGKFEIPDVPTGQYELVAWHERCGEQRQTIEVRSDAPEVSLTLEENRQNIIAHDPPKRDADYGIERGLGVKRERLNLPVVKDSHPAPDAPPK